MFPLTVYTSRTPWMAIAMLVAGLVLIALQTGQSERIGEYCIVSAMTLATVATKGDKKEETP